ncbi:MAG TPA: HD domain-containing protein [Spirochaetales bacterium]|nr:HD domain-containing protein [Spirochaetales bacterium]HRY56506.1 HD domain-containing protein [Spirochaetia bacterium]
MSNPERPVVLCVDDERIVLLSLKAELRSSLGAEARVETAESGEEALAFLGELAAEGIPLALVISDLRMPGMGGDQLLAHVRERDAEAKSILLTGYADLDAVASAINHAGLYRFLTKPWRREDLAMTAREALASWTSQRLIEEKNRTIELLTVSMVTALENVNLVNDEETGLHVRRVGEYARVLALALGKEGPFVKRLSLYASLHDIGKIGVPREVLVSGMRYSPQERETMKRHVLHGGRMLDMPGIDPMARNVALYHHERWDGKGYAAGLAGEDIPLEARIVSVADVFDAMTTARPYKEPISPGIAVREILEGAGAAFDPAVVEAFRASLPQIMELCACGELRDRDGSSEPGRAGA